MAGAVVTFAIARPNPAKGSLSGIGASGAVSGTTISVVSDAAGVAEAEWTLDPSPTEPVQRVTATLVTTVNPAQKAPPPLEYTADLDLASGVAYEPGECASLAGQTTVQGALDKLCDDLSKLTASQIGYKDGKCAGLKDVTNVQDALDKLCRDILNTGRPEFIIVTEVALPRAGRLLDNNEELKPEELLDGFVVRFSEPLATKLRERFDEGNPIARLTLDLPFPSDPSSQNWWSEVSQIRGKRFVFGTSPLHLSGTITILDDLLEWKPDPAAKLFLERWSLHRFGLQGDSTFEEQFLKGWITLKGHSLWAGEGMERRYLNGEMLRFETDSNMFSIFGDRNSRLKPEELLRNVDPQRAADFELWFKIPLDLPR